MLCWQQAKDELKNVPMSYTKELAKEYCTDKIDCYLVKLQMDQRSCDVRLPLLSQECRAGWPILWFSHLLEPASRPSRECENHRMATLLGILGIRRGSRTSHDLSYLSEALQDSNLSYLYNIPWRVPWYSSSARSSVRPLPAARKHRNP